MPDGTMISFPVNGTQADGYLAAPDGGGPGLLVVQEWWGLDPAIKATCDRLAGEGFVALAPDLYHGDLAEHTEMDKAGELMNSLPPDRAARDMSGAIDHLLGRDEVHGDRRRCRRLLHGRPPLAGHRQHRGRPRGGRGAVLRGAARRG